MVITKKCGDHEIFVTKIFNHGIFSNFMKILNHANMELYGILAIPYTLAGVHNKECATHTIVVQTSLSRYDITTTLVHGPEYH